MNIKSTWSYVNKGLLAILSLLVVCSVGAMLYLAHMLLTLRALTTEGSRAVTTAVILQDLMINLQDAQIGQRGYILTGDPSFLKPYDRAVERVPPDLQIIRNNQDILLSHKERQQVSAHASGMLESLRQIKETRDLQGYEAAQAQIAGGDGEDAMEDFRKEITGLSSSGLQNIGPMQRKSAADIHRALWVGSFMGALILATCGAVMWYFKRAILQERALESTKNEFLSLASHQLRTPATNVKQYIGLLLDGYMGEMNDKQRHALEVAYKNNEAEISIMNNLLDVAKLDLNRIQLHKQVTDVMKIARHVVRDHKSVIKEHNQTVELDGPKQVMASVDESYVKGILENLLDNASKYSRDGTKIKITVDRERDQVCIDVSDTGLGIKKRDFGKLFNKFSRLDNEFSANSQGSGLGLYWVKKIVGLHGGTIDVSSHEGSGSNFSVKLPVR